MLYMAIRTITHHCNQAGLSYIGILCDENMDPIKVNGGPQWMLFRYIPHLRNIFKLGELVEVESLDSLQFVGYIDTKTA